MKRFLASAVITFAVLVVAACSAGASGGGPAPSIDPDALRIAAKDMAFSTNTLTAPADEPFQIAFDNKDGAPHNVAIYRDSSASEKVFGEDPLNGPAVAVYDVPALTAGTYFFRCDVHPDMSGQLIVG